MGTKEMLYLFYCQESGSSPGHMSVLHLWIWESGPPQALPPLEGRGLSHVRYRRICPPLHVRLHIPQPLQGLQLPWATTQNHWRSAKEWHSSKKYGKTLSRNWKETHKSINKQIPKAGGLVVGLTRNRIHSSDCAIPFNLHLLSVRVFQELEDRNEKRSLRSPAITFRI